jgi:hypothetical protein
MSQNSYRRFSVFYLLLLPAFYLAHGWAENKDIVRLRDVLVLLPVYWSAQILLFGVLWLFFRRIRQAGLGAFILMAVFLFFGYIHDGLKHITGENFISSYRMVLLLLALMISFLFWKLKKHSGHLNKLTQYLNLLLILLLLIDAISILKPAKRIASLQPLPRQNVLPESRPDIYLILTDGYAGEQELNALFGFSNSVFKQALERRGFFVVPGTRSNYNYTAFSMASLLNMDYLPLGTNKYTSESELSVCFPLVRENRFDRFLESAGYKRRNFSVFEIGNDPAAIRSPFFRTADKVLTSATLLSRLNRDVRFQLLTRFQLKSERKRYARYSVDEGNRNAIQMTLEESRKRDSAPRFIYTHLLLPHEPYFYRKDGSENPVEYLLDYQNLRPDLYLEYLQYANGRLLSLIGGILANSERPPVILLLSDHGYRGQNGKGVAPALQFANLNAILLPSRDYRGWYPGISNVNHLRVFLNTQFKQQIPLLRDSTSYLVE